MKSEGNNFSINSGIKSIGEIMKMSMEGGSAMCMQPSYLQPPLLTNFEERSMLTGMTIENDRERRLITEIEEEFDLVENEPKEAQLINFTGSIINQATEIGKFVDQLNMIIQN